MDKFETKIAEAKCEVGIKAYLAHADDHKDGFEQGVLAVFGLCREQLNIRGVYILELFAVHQNPRLSSILRKFQRYQAEKVKNSTPPK